MGRRKQAQTESEQSEQTSANTSHLDKATELYLTRLLDQFHVDSVVQDVSALREFLLQLLFGPSRDAEIRQDCAALLDQLTRLQEVLMLFLDATDEKRGDRGK